MNFKVSVMFLCYPQTLQVFFFLSPRMIRIEGGGLGWRVARARDPALQTFYGYTHHPNHPPLPLVGLSQEGTAALSCIFCGLISIEAKMGPLRWPENSCCGNGTGKKLRVQCLTTGGFFVFTGSGYLEGKELQNLIQELQQARKKAGLVGWRLQGRKETFALE